MNDITKQLLTTIAESYDSVREGAGDCVREAIAELPETDLVILARNEVVEAAKRWKKSLFPRSLDTLDAEAGLVGALVVLEAREEVDDKLKQATKDTEGLQPVEVER